MAEGGFRRLTPDENDDLIDATVLQKNGSALVRGRTGGENIVRQNDGITLQSRKCRFVDLEGSTKLFPALKRRGK